MTHTSAEDIAAFVAGALDEALIDQVTEHAMVCSLCALAIAKEVEFEHRLYAVVQRRKKSRGYGRVFSAVGAIAAVVVAAVTVGLSWREESKPKLFLPTVDGAVATSLGLQCQGADTLECTRRAHRMGLVVRTAAGVALFPEDRASRGTTNGPEAVW